MARGTYDNSYNRNRTRVDTRNQNDPAVQAGMRNIHRDTDGSVIGGRTAEGQNVGTMSNANRSRFAAGGSPTPRLDAGPQTPRLDAMARPTPNPKAENLAGRQSLFRDMQKVGGVTAEMKQRAASLGIDDKQMSNGMSKIKPVNPLVGPPSPVVTAAPLQGKEKAMADMAKYGVGGAAERAVAAQKQDQARRAEADKTKLAGRQSLFRDMKKAGPLNLTPEMRQRGRELGVDDKGWDKALGKVNARKTPTNAVIAMEPTIIKPGSSSVTSPPSAPAAPPKPPVSTPTAIKPVTAPAPAPAPNPGLGKSAFNDARQAVNAVVNHGKAANSAAGNAVTKTINTTQNALNSAINGADAAMKDSFSKGTAIMTAGPKSTINMIPGQSGDAVRAMNIPQKAEAGLRNAGNSVQKGITSFLRKATGQRFDGSR